MHLADAHLPPVYFPSGEKKINCFLYPTIVKFECVHSRLGFIHINKTSWKEHLRPSIPLTFLEFN